MRILVLILSLLSFQDLKADDQANLYLIGTIHNLHKSSSFTELLPLLNQCSFGHLVSPNEFLNFALEKRAEK